MVHDNLISLCQQELGLNYKLVSPKTMVSAGVSLAILTTNICSDSFIWLENFQFQSLPDDPILEAWPKRLSSMRFFYCDFLYTNNIGFICSQTLIKWCLGASLFESADVMTLWVASPWVAGIRRNEEHLAYAVNHSHQKRTNHEPNNENQVILTC